NRRTGEPENRRTGEPENRRTGEPENRRTGEPENREPRKHAQVCWVDADVIPEEFVDTTATASTLHRYLAGGPQVSLDGWQ
ncbi:hypothetical protein ACIBO9_23870, partial [Streptomyces prunicolor]